MENDILLIDKPAGWTSFDVIAKIRGARKRHLLEAARSEEGKGAAGATDSFRAPRDEGKPLVVPHVTKRQLRVGHAGTLDPFATGLLIVLLGDGTKKAGEFLKLDKTYEATITLGKTSTTGDPEGEITEVNNRQPTREQVESALEKFTGPITQTPPAYSAIKINGQRAYKLARKGQEIEIPTRQVEIYSIELLEYTYPELKIRAHVSSGTYVRTLSEDIGTALNTGAYCSTLRRLSIADYSIEQALTIEQALAKV